MNLDFRRLHLVVENVLEQRVQVTLLDAFVEHTLELWAIGARGNIPEEVLSDGGLRVASRDCAFGRVVLEDFSSRVDLDGTERQVVELGVIHLAEGVFDVVLAKGDGFKSSFHVGVFRVWLKECWASGSTSGIGNRAPCMSKRTIGRRSCGEIGWRKTSVSRQRRRLSTAISGVKACQLLASPTAGRSVQRIAAERWYP